MSAARFSYASAHSVPSRDAGAAVHARRAADSARGRGDRARISCEGAFACLLAATLCTLGHGAHALAQSRFDERARTYMIEHCLEMTAKRIDPEHPITIGFVSGETVEGRFVRASSDTLVVQHLGGSGLDAAGTAYEKARIHSLRFTNRPMHNLGRGVLGFVAGYIGSAGVMVLVLEAGDRELSYGDWPLIFLGLTVGSAIGFTVGYSSTMTNPGESTILCR